MHSDLLDIIEKMDFNQIFIYDDFSKRSITYNEYFRECINLAEHIENEVTTDSIVVIMENSYELSCLYFALMMTPKKLLVIDPQKGKEEIHRIISSIEPTYMIKDDNVEIDSIHKYSLVDLSRMSNVCEFTEDVKKFFLSKIVTRGKKTPYLVTFTSGTSGVIKGVEHTLENLFLSAVALDKKVIKPIEPIFLHVMPMTYMAGILNSLVYPFLAGAKIVLMRRFTIFSARSFWDNVIKYSINLFWLSPSMLMMIEQLDRSDKGEEYCKKNKLVFLIGTAALTDKIREKFNQRYKVDVFASYGLSETLFVSVETQKSLKTSEGNSVGEMLDGVKFIFNNEEILLDVPWMYLGYTNERTAEYFYGQYYMSGDLARMGDNNLYITGRKKDLIIKGGMNYSPALIEDVILKSVNAIQECVVIGVNNAEGEEKICCIYTTLENREDLDNCIRSTVLSELGKNYYIDYLWKVDSMVRNINGKIDRNFLRKSWEEKNAK